MQCELQLLLEKFFGIHENETRWQLLVEFVKRLCVTVLSYSLSLHEN